MPEAPCALGGCAAPLVRAHSVERTVQGGLGCSGLALSPMLHVGNRGVTRAQPTSRKREDGPGQPHDGLKIGWRSPQGVTVEGFTADVWEHGSWPDAVAADEQSKRGRSRAEAPWHRPQADGARARLRRPGSRGRPPREMAVFPRCSTGVCAVWLRGRSVSVSRDILRGAVVIGVWCAPAAALPLPQWEEPVCLWTVLFWSPAPRAGSAA